MCQTNPTRPRRHLPPPPSHSTTRRDVPFPRLTTIALFHRRPQRPQLVSPNFLSHPISLKHPPAFPSIQGTHAQKHSPPKGFTPSGWWPQPPSSLLGKWRRVVRYVCIVSRIACNCQSGQDCLGRRNSLRFARSFEDSLAACERFKIPRVKLVVVCLFVYLFRHRIGNFNLFAIWKVEMGYQVCVCRVS